MTRRCPTCRARLATDAECLSCKLADEYKLRTLQAGEVEYMDSSKNRDRGEEQATAKSVGWEERRDELRRAKERKVRPMADKQKREVVIATDTDPAWYVCQIRGAVFVSWVQDIDVQHALKFPADKADEWIGVVSKMAGRKLIAVPSEEGDRR